MEELNENPNSIPFFTTSSSIALNDLNTFIESFNRSDSLSETNLNVYMAPGVYEQSLQNLSGGSSNPQYSFFTSNASWSHWNRDPIKQDKRLLEKIGGSMGMFDLEPDPNIKAFMHRIFEVQDFEHYVQINSEFSIVL